MIIWLASYPKSGNTWLRFFIISLISKDNDNLKLTSLDKIDQFPRRHHYDKLNILDLDLKNLNKISNFWLDSQTKINSDNKIRFFKTHNSFCKIDNNIFTDETNTLGTIYIVRDPRNVITSIKNHFHHNTIEQSRDFLFDENKGIFNKSKIKENSNYALPQVIGSWKTHYKSWKSMKKNYLLIKYENLVNDPINEFKKISNYLEVFLNMKFSDELIKRAIKLSSFERLKKIEEIEGFSESPLNLKTNKREKFFNLGPKNNWQHILSKDLSNQIENVFRKEMEELGYL